MATFTDDFNRANGGLGDNWLPATVNPVVSSNKAYASVSTSARYVVSQGTGPHDATVTVFNTLTSDIGNGPIVKCAADRSMFYYGRLSGSSGAYNAQIFRGTATQQQIVSAYCPIVLGSSATFRLVYSAGTLFFYVDGVLRATGYDTNLDANQYVGMYVVGASSGIDAFTTATTDTPTFAVSPTAAQTNGPPLTITLSGTGTAWTPGTPGTPAFSVGAGSISDQVVVSSGYATATFTPPVANQTVTVTDPSTGLHAYIVCSSDVPPGGGGVGFAAKLTDNGAAIINRAGETPPVDGVRVWTNQDVVTTSPIAMNQNDALRYLVQYIWFLAGGPNPGTDINPATEVWKWISGTNLLTSWDPTLPTQTTLKQDLATIIQQGDDLSGYGSLSLGALLSSLRGSGDYDHTQLYNAITAISGGSNDDVIALLMQIWGPGFPTLTNLATLINSIVSASGYGIDEVLRRIDDRPTYAWANGALAEINGLIGGLALEIAAVAAAETEDAASSSAGAASAAGALAWLLANGPTILDVLNQLKDLLSPQGQDILVPPIWPGEPNVEMGTPIAIESNESVIGPMHGVVVEITGCQPGTRYFDYDGIKSYGHLGALAFCTDRGDLEPFQPMGYEAGVYVPKTMAVALKCRLYRSRLVRGWITPWTRKPS